MTEGDVHRGIKRGQVDTEPRVLDGEVCGKGELVARQARNVWDLGFETSRRPKVQVFESETMIRNKRELRRGGRRGATAVELAVIAPVFGIFLAGIMEFGHAFLTVGTLNAAAKQAARYGAVEGISSTEVETRADNILSAAVDTTSATYLVKDASIFDSGSVPESIDYSGLPDIELLNAERRQLYVVRIEIPYNDVAIMPPFWAKDLTLVGQSVMRHE